MKSFFALTWLLILAHHPLGSAAQISDNTLNRHVMNSSVPIRRDSSDSQEEPPIIIHRCRAEELSPGSALAILIVLATASAIHMPGSLIVPRRARFYRLSPELGLADTVMTVLLILKAMFAYRKTLRQSVTAVLLLRHFRADHDLWWQSKALYVSPAPNEATTSESESSSLSNSGSSPAWRQHCFECTKPALRRVGRFGYERLLSDALVLLAATKAFAITGSTRTILIAASYLLSFLTIEILSFAAVHIGVPPTRAEQEAQAEACAELITLLDDRGDAWKFRSSPRWEIAGSTWRASACYGLAWLVYGLPAALHFIFWPFSVPLFLLFEFEEKHSGNGKWVLSYLVSAKWLLWVSLAGCATAGVLSLPVLAMSMAGEKMEQRKKAYADMWGVLLKRVGEAFAESGWFDAYTALKVVLIVRCYASGEIYTGKDTTKPEWLEWLG